MKEVRDTHITGEAGVIKFAAYCNQHNPYIIFREVLKNDFGIDGEIELTRRNESNKIEPTGEIIKVQIKSSASENSYIRHERDNYFEFHPKKEDLAYWEKYRNKGLDVLLIIYDKRSDALYCKKVIQTDIYIGKESLKTKRKKNLNAIQFDKIENKLEIGESSFTTKYSVNFNKRVSYDVKETILTNMLKVKIHPKQLYKYPAKFKNKKAIFQNITNEQAPFFVLYNEAVYTFHELGNEYKIFIESILSSKQYTRIPYIEIVEDKTLKNYYSELLNEHLKSFLWSKRITFSKDYKRFYFKLLEEEPVIVETTTRKRGQYSAKAVVKKFEYKLSFYRHVAVEFNYLYKGEDLYIILQPKYLFTEDGKKTLSPENITKLTNFLTSREYNNHFCDWLHFWFTFLSKGKDEILIYEHPEYKKIEPLLQRKYLSKYPKIVLSNYYKHDVNFGIHVDQKIRKSTSTQVNKNLLFNED